VKTERIAISQLKPAEKNVRRHPENQIKELMRSIEMFGQIRPIVVDEEYRILAGNGLFLALQRMGRTEADVLVMRGLTENQKKKLMIADNRVYDLGVNDWAALEEVLAELGDDLDIPGFEMEVLLGIIGGNDEIMDKVLEYGKLEPEEVEAVREAGRRVEARIEAATQAHQVESDSEEVTERPISAPADEPAKIEKYVVCPKCGETIWL